MPKRSGRGVRVFHRLLSKSFPPVSSQLLIRWWFIHKFQPVSFGVEGKDLPCVRAWYRGRSEGNSSGAQRRLDAF